MGPSLGGLSRTADGPHFTRNLFGPLRHNPCWGRHPFVSPDPACSTVSFSIGNPFASMRDNFAAPVFEDAVRRFQAFLRTQDWPEALVWVEQSQIVQTPRGIFISPSGQTDNPVEIYEIARRRRLGVTMEAICTLDDSTCAVITFPSDALDAELLMYPADGGLKLSVAIPRIAGVLTSRRAE